MGEHRGANRRAVPRSARLGPTATPVDRPRYTAARRASGALRWSHHGWRSALRRCLSHPRRLGDSLERDVGRSTPTDRWVGPGAQRGGKDDAAATGRLASASLERHSDSPRRAAGLERRVRNCDQRIGFASTALARRIPPSERVLDVVMTSAHAVTGRYGTRATTMSTCVAPSACCANGNSRHSKTDASVASV